MTYRPSIGLTASAFAVLAIGAWWLAGTSRANTFAPAESGSTGRTQFVVLLNSVKPTVGQGANSLPGDLRAFSACVAATPVGRPPNRH